MAEQATTSDLTLATSEPVIVEPATAEQSAVEPAISEPATSEPATSEPATSEPATSEPSTSEPSTSDSTTSEPSTSEPSTSEPSTSEPASSDSAADQSAAAAIATVEKWVEKVEASIRNAPREDLEFWVKKIFLIRKIVTGRTAIDWEATITTKCSVCGHTATRQTSSNAFYGFEAWFEAFNVKINRDPRCPEKCIGHAVIGFEECPNKCNYLGGQSPKSD